MRALVAEAVVCGPSLRGLREALESRLAKAAFMRPLWTASAPKLVELLVTQRRDVDTVQRCCALLLKQISGQATNRDAAEEAGASARVSISYGSTRRP